MDVVHRCCRGLDVHKATVVACPPGAAADGRRSKEPRPFGTLTDDVLTRADWPRAAGRGQSARESSGVYWKPVFNLLADRSAVGLANPRHLNTLPAGYRQWEYGW